MLGRRPDAGRNAPSGKDEPAFSVTIEAPRVRFRIEVSKSRKPREFHVRPNPLRRESHGASLIIPASETARLSASILADRVFVNAKRPRKSRSCARVKRPENTDPHQAITSARADVPTRVTDAALPPNLRSFSPRGVGSFSGTRRAEVPEFEFRSGRMPEATQLKSSRVWGDDDSRAFIAAESDALPIDVIRQRHHVFPVLKRKHHGEVCRRSPGRQRGWKG